MDNPKEIGQAFKDRMVFLQKTPNKKTWEQIELQLDQKKKKKRIIPLWIRVSGVAALLALFLIVNKNSLFQTQPLNKKPLNQDVSTISIDSINDSKLKIVDSQKTEPELNKPVNAKNISPIKSIVYKISSNTSQTENLLVEREGINKPNTTFTSDEIIVAKKIIPNQIITENDTLSGIAHVDDESQRDIQLMTNSVSGNSKEIAIIENQTKDEETRNIEVTINSSPVTYNSFSNESSLSSNWDENPKKSIVTLGFGINVGIPLSNSLKLRAGFNQMNLSYLTESIYKSEILNSQIINPNSYFLENVDASSGNSVDGNPYDLVQNLTFYEIPIEVQYLLSDKKIKIGLVSGFSTLFLQKNSINIDQTSIGSVKNIKKTSFTGNIGLNFNKNLTKNWSFSIEPMVKFQLNPYRNTSLNNKPYILGLNLGLTKKL